jgi:hypothetical protein
MEEVIEKLKVDYPGHTFETKEYEGTSILVIDGHDTPLTYTNTKNILENQKEERETAEEALYEVLKMEVNKVLDDLNKE